MVSAPLYMGEHANARHTLAASSMGQLVGHGMHVRTHRALEASVSSDVSSVGVAPMVALGGYRFSPQGL